MLVLTVEPDVPMEPIVKRHGSKFPPISLGHGMLPQIQGHWAVPKHVNDRPLRLRKQRTGHDYTALVYILMHW